MLNYPVLGTLLRALADPTRRVIIELLCDEDACVTQIAESLPLALPTVMAHVRALEKVSLIRTHKIGRVRTCWFEPQALDLLDQWVRERRNRCQRRESRR